MPPGIPNEDPFVAPKNVLVLEDEPIIAMNAEDMLDELGTRCVRTAHNIESAMALIERFPFDLALLDYRLGKEDCTAVAKMLCARNVPIIVATGLDEVNLPEECRQPPLLRKPYGLTDLQQAIRAS